MKTSLSPIAGKWHLIEASQDEVNVPQHRVDFVFREEGNTLTGAIINRVTGDDIPLANVKFDGNMLTLQMADSNGKPVPAVLTMTASGDRLEGGYRNDRSESLGPTLKLVRFRQ